MTELQSNFRELTSCFKARPIRLILLGAPGVGKGTQSDNIKNLYNLRHLSTGDLLRAEVQSGSEIGKKADVVMKAGQLIDDDTMIAIIKSQMTALGQETGWILDGFPRTPAQAEALDTMLEETNMPLSGVFHFHVDDKVVVDRILGRWSHTPSGRIYNTNFQIMTPKKVVRNDDGKVLEAYDDVTGDLLTRRKDDNAVSIVKRLQNYYDFANDIITHYKSKKLLITIDTTDNHEACTLLQLALGPPPKVNKATL